MRRKVRGTDKTKHLLGDNTLLSLPFGEKIAQDASRGNHKFAPEVLADDGMRTWKALAKPLADWVMRVD